MTTTVHTADALLDELVLDLDALCRLAGVPEPWLLEHVTLGLLSAHGMSSQAVSPHGTSPHGRWRFDAIALRRVRRMAGLERDFDAVPELAALVVDLEEELAALRARLQRLGDAGR